MDRLKYIDMNNVSAIVVRLSVSSVTCSTYIYRIVWVAIDIQKYDIHAIQSFVYGGGLSMSVTQS